MTTYTVLFLSLTTGEDQFAGNFTSLADAKAKANKLSANNSNTFAYVTNGKRIVYKVGS